MTKLTPLFVSELDGTGSFCISCTWVHSVAKSGSWFARLFGRKTAVDIDLHALIFDALGKHIQTVNYKCVRSSDEALLYTGDTLANHSYSSEFSAQPTHSESMVLKPKKLDSKVHRVVFMVSTLAGHDLAALKQVSFALTQGTEASVNASSTANNAQTSSSDKHNNQQKGNLLADTTLPQQDGAGGKKIKSYQCCEFTRHLTDAGDSDWFVSQQQKPFATQDIDKISQLISATSTQPA